MRAKANFQKIENRFSVICGIIAIAMGQKAGLASPGHFRQRFSRIYYGDSYMISFPKVLRGEL